MKSSNQSYQSPAEASVEREEVLDPPLSDRRELGVYKMLLASCPPQRRFQHRYSGLSAAWQDSGHTFMPKGFGCSLAGRVTTPALRGPRGLL